MLNRVLHPASVILSLIIICLLAQPVKAQLVGAECYLQENFTEVGVSDCGSYGTTTALAPVGYHPNAGFPAGTLGFVADWGRDGWNTGTPEYCGDYFLPGSPVEGWGVQFNGTTYVNGSQCASTDVPGAITGYSNIPGIGGESRAFWEGSIAGLDVKQQTYIVDSGLYIVNEVVLINTTGADMNDVYYLRHVDPDNDQPWPGGAFTTVNTVVSQPNTSVCDALVTAVGTGFSGACYLGLGARASNARVSHGNFSLPTQISDVYNGLAGYDTVVGSVQTADDAISLAFYWPVLEAGDSVNFALAYVLSASDLEEALNATGGSFVYADGEDITNTLLTLTCPGDIAELAMLADTSYTWTWEPNYNISDTIGDTVIVQPDTTTVYTATGVNGPCGTLVRNITVVVDSNVVVDAGKNDTICQGESITLKAKNATLLQWTPTAFVSDDSSATTVATPPATQWFTVTSVCGVDSVLVYVADTFELNMANDTTICRNGIATLAARPPAAFGPYEYLWTPFESLTDDSTRRVTYASPEVTTTYHVTAMSAYGCEQTDSMEVFVVGIGPAITLLKDNDGICPGDTVNVSALVSAVTCGVNPDPLSPCPPTSTFVIGDVGTPSGLSTTSTTPYNGFFEDGRIQILYRATELNAAGVSSGTITDIGFNVINKLSTTPFNNFTIKMGCTELTTLDQPDFIPGLATVDGPAPYLTNLGWNNHNLDNPYNWDGISNLVVEVCFDNTSWTTADAVEFTTTAYASTLVANADFASGCTIGFPFTDFDRPNTRFVACNYALPDLNYAWTPTGGLITPADQPNASMVVYEDRTYTLNVSDTTTGCISSGQVTINVDSSYYVSAGPDLLACNGESVVLDGEVYGDPPPKTLVCGVNLDACVAGSDSFTLENPFPNSTIFTPFLADTGFFTGATISDQRMQILYLADDLTAAGFEPGIITGLGFDVVSKVSRRPFKDLNVKLGCTSVDDLTGASWLPTEIVYTVDTYSTGLGWNVFNLDSTFNWDGTSNLVVEVCWNNVAADAPRGVDQVNANTFAAYNSIHTNISALGNGCVLTPNPTNVTNILPSLRLNMCPPPPADISYVWSPVLGLSDPFVQDPTATPPSTTLYTLTATFANGCVRVDSALVTIAELNTSITPDTSICEGDVLQLLASGETGSTFSWDTTTGGLSCYDCANPTVTSDTTTTFTVTITGANGCVITEQVTVDVSGVTATAWYGGDTLIDQGDPIILGANVSGGGGIGTYVYSWTPTTYLSDPGVANPSANPLDDITYTLTVVSGACSDTTLLFVDVNIIESPVAIPTVFSPNGDGLNDLIEVLTLGNATIKEFKIYNRWGEMVFSEPSGAWDGTYAGDDQPVGTYVYSVVVERPLQKDEHLQGTITLIR